MTDLQIRPGNFANLDTPAHSEMSKEEVATAFEEIFARQLVKTMTKGLFKHDDNGILGAGSDIYRMNIVNTLSHELAEQHALGIADMINRYLYHESGGNHDG